MPVTNATPQIGVYKFFNGTEWIKVYFVTSAGAVYETSNRMFVSNSREALKGNYDPTVTYNYGDIVKYTPSGTETYHYYRCLSQTLGHDPENITYWEEFDLTRPGESTDVKVAGHFSSAQAGKLAGISAQATRVTATTSSGVTTVSIDGTPVFYISESGTNTVIKTDINGKISMDVIPDALIGALKYKGTWDPTVSKSSPVADNPQQGDYYVATNAGDYNPDGTDTGIEYNIGDWAIYNGESWDEIDNQTPIVSVNGRQGIIQTYRGTYGNTATPDTAKEIFYSGDIISHNGTLWLVVTTIPQGTAWSTALVGLESFGGSDIDSANTQNVLTYVCNSSGNYFQRTLNSDRLDSNNRNIKYIQNITSDVTASRNISTSSGWGPFYEYVRTTLLRFGITTGSGDITQRYAGAAYLFPKTGFAPNFISYFVATSSSATGVNNYKNWIASSSDIDSIKIEAVGEYASEAECTIKITAWTVSGREYQLQIACVNGSYVTDQWHPVIRVNLTANSTATGNIPNPVYGDICIEEV